jgi:hypothetical protein
MEIPMKREIAIRVAALAALACAGSAGAHHSFFAYQTTPIWITGSVVRFEHVNPHTIITLEGKSAGGQLRRWAVEGPAQAALDRRGSAVDVPKVDDTLKVCAFPYKPAEELSRIWPDVDFSTRRSARPPDGSSPQFVSGRVMVISNGEKRMWNAHGLISECIRSSDEPRQSWLDFLNSNPGVRQGFCDQRASQQVQSSSSLRDFADEINGSLAEPCN